MSEVRMLALSPMLMLLLSLLMASFFDTTAGQIGVCYGEYGNNLPSNSEAVAMYKQYNIRRMRMYGPNPNALDALRGSNIELSSTFPMATYNVSQIAKRRPAHGSETTSRSTTMSDSDVSSSIGLLSLHTTIIAYSQLPTRFLLRQGSGFPPSSGSFTPNFRIFIAPVINFLVSKKSPLLVNIYTYFTYANNMRDVRLEYALLTPSETVVTDRTNTYGINLFVALLDTAYVALEKLRGGAVKIVVSESGWPTAGGTAASVYNARTYVKNLIQTVNSKTGTPRRPERVTETYLLLDFDIRLVNNCSDISGSRLDNRR
ncbi:hypothetical protein Bca52824_047374 [Brassica carinata]|nr:hypothetical protein Bca52824_047374 [Brassica carinata]